jgi:hypothetical protein
MEAEVFGDLEAVDHIGHGHDWLSGFGSDRDCLHHNLFAAVEVIDEEERRECEENQDDCHNPPFVRGLFLLLGRSPHLLKAFVVPKLKADWRKFFMGYKRLKMGWLRVRLSVERNNMDGKFNSDLMRFASVNSEVSVA